MKKILLFLTLGLCFSCDKDSVDYNSPCDFTAAKNASAYMDGPFDGTTHLNYADYNGECLDLSLSYSGGCEDHTFDIVTDGNVIETSPPILKLAVVHDNQDLCEAYITEIISIDISQLDAVKEYEDLIIKFKNNDELSVSVN